MTTVPAPGPAQARRQLRVRVELAAGLDPAGWALRHARGEVPDATPYGLHHMATSGIDVDLNSVTPKGAVERVARSLRHRSNGLELIEATHRRGDADAVLCYDERTGVPALWRPRRSVPVVTGVGWLTTFAATPALHARLARVALPRAARVWAQCRPMLPLLVSEWGVDPDRVQFIPFGIDTNFYGVQRAVAPSAIGTVFSAGEDRHRDHEVLLAAIRAIRVHHPEVRLNLATSMPTSFTPDLGRLDIGRLDGAIRSRYAAANVVAVALHSTVTGSGLSVILEAMASGRPVVATANPGLDDYIDHGRTGLLVPPGNVRALAAALTSLLRDPPRAAALGAEAARDVRRRFSSTVMAAALAGVLREVVER